HFWPVDSRRYRRQINSLAEIGISKYPFVYSWPHCQTVRSRLVDLEKVCEAKAWHWGGSWDVSNINRNWWKSRPAVNVIMALEAVPRSPQTEEGRVSARGGDFRP